MCQEILRIHDVDSKELLALEASYGRSSLNSLSFLKKALKMCTNKPLVIVDKGPWYRWAFERLGLEYRHERFGMRNRVERFFRYLKERTVVFHHKMSARDHIQEINNLKLFLSLFTIYYQATRTGRSAKMLIWTLSHCVLWSFVCLVILNGMLLGLFFLLCLGLIGYG